MPDSHYERNNGPEDCEIEITPEMIEAGTEVLLGWDPEYDPAERCVSAIYRARIARHLPRLPTLLSNESREDEREKRGNSGGALARGPGSPFLFFSGLTIPAPPLRAGLGAWGSYSWSSVCQSEGTRPAGPGTG